MKSLSIDKTQIRLLVMDVDGTLTDGKVHLGPDGEVYKSFDVKDGYGICRILPKHGITPAIITGRRSAIVERRAEELGIKQLYQGIEDKGVKVQALANALEIPLTQTACMGDDLNDLPMMQCCGICGCPANAAEEIKAAADFVSHLAGGCGAVREFIDWLTGSPVCV